MMTKTRKRRCARDVVPECRVRRARDVLLHVFDGWSRKGDVVGMQGLAFGVVRRQWYSRAIESVACIV